MVTYKSEALTLQQNDTRTLPLAFLQARGPKRGRNVISRLILKYVVQVDTNGATTIAAGGWANFVKRLRIWDAQGDIVNLTGPEIRALHILENGRNALPDPALLAISQTDAARTLYLVIDFAPRRRARRRWDYALPVDTLHTGGGIEIQSAAAADIGTGGGTTIDSQVATFYFETREENDVQTHTRRELRSVSQANLLDIYLPVNGGVVRSAFLFKYADHITGGATQNTTALTVEAFGLTRIEPDILQRELALEGENDLASTSDPFVQATLRAVPLVWSKGDGKILDYYQHPGQVLVRLEGSTVSSNVVVYELITKRTEFSTLAEQALVGGEGNGSMKTFSKTKKDPKAWGAYARIMPGKIVRASDPNRK